MKNKLDALKKILSGYDSILVAFSGGIDSTFLLAVAHSVLQENAVALTSISSIHSEREKKIAIDMAKYLNVRHIFTDCNQIDYPEFTANNIDRCYICKRILFEKMKTFDFPYILHGENIDDLNESRPGYKAALEMGIKAPLIEAGIDKKTIRNLSKDIGIEIWNKPSVSCLATRIPHGMRITLEKLKMIEKGEAFLYDLGALSCKVRIYGKSARIKLSRSDFDIISKRNEIEKLTKEFKKIGFAKILLALP